MTPRTQVKREPRETLEPLRPHDAASVRQAQDEAALARCPLCRRVLIARQGRHGPYFACACPKKRPIP